MTLTTLVGKTQQKLTAEKVREIITESLSGPPNNRQDAMQSILDQVSLDSGLPVEMPLPWHLYIAHLISAHPLSNHDRSAIELTRTERVGLMMYLLAGSADPDRIWVGALREAVTSGALLRYNPESRTLEDSDHSLAVGQLVHESEQLAGVYRGLFEPLRIQVLHAISESNRQRRQSFALEWDQAVPIWGMYNAQVNFYRRVASLYGYLTSRKPTPFPENLVPGTPFGAEEEEKINREITTRSDIQKWFTVPDYWNL